MYMDLETTKDTFRRDGVVVVRDFYPREAIADILQALVDFADWDQVRPADVVFDNPTDTNDRPLKYMAYVNCYMPEFSRLVTSQALSLVSHLFDGQDVFFDQLEIHDKAPGGGTRTPPHQDNFYFCYDPPDACTVYAPLENHAVDNGGLCFVKGSHLGDTAMHEPSKVKAFSSFVNIDLSQLSSEQILEADLEPGDIVIHHCKTIHYTGENHSTRSRRSVSMRVNGERARVSEKLRENYLENLKFNRGS
jgi:phytanoyl-CoA hydroxylase